MVAPLVIAGAAAALGAAGAVSRAYMHRYLRAHRKDIEEWALNKAFEAAGFPDLTGDTVTKKSFSDAITEKFLAGSGIELTNIFDRNVLQKDIERAAIKKACEAMGISVSSVSDTEIKDGIKSWVIGEIKKQVDSGGGELIDGAKEIKSIMAAVVTYRKNKEKLTTGLDMSEHGIKNRERQARFRANHKRHWENI
jgi:hypothetical protein